MFQNVCVAMFFFLSTTLYILLCFVSVNHLLSCPCIQDGMTPLDVANVMGSDESAELLKEMMVIHYIIILNDLIIVVYARALNLLALK